MNTKTFLVPFLAVLTLLSIGFATAGLADNLGTTFNDVELVQGSTNMAGFSGDVVPLRVTFRAGETAEDVKVRAEIYGGRDDIEVSTMRFNIVEGNTYTKLLNLELPSDLDDEVLKDLTLYVKVYDADHEKDDTEKSYVIKMQRDSYDIEVLSVDYNLRANAGEILPVAVVFKNIGYQRADDNYVVVSIPALGVSSRGYAGDLIPTEDCVIDCEDEEDSVQKTLYLQIPDSAEQGLYDLEVRVYNRDSETVVRKTVSLGGSASTMVLAAVKNQDMKAGETKIFDLIVVNSADNVKVFNIQTVSGTDLTVSAPSVVTVGPDSSETVQIEVTADRSADVGTYTFSVDVDGEQVVFGANVIGGSVSASVVALTVILVIIFVVLLVVLIVLLTRKERPMEEVETSYY